MWTQLKPVANRRPGHSDDRVRKTKADETNKGQSEQEVTGAIHCGEFYHAVGGMVGGRQPKF